MKSPSSPYDRSKTRRLVLSSLLTAVAIGLMAVERSIPINIAIPGVKLGLANVVTLIALYLFNWKDTLSIIVLRLLLGALILGTFSAFLFSAGGALLAFLIMLLLVKGFPNVFDVLGVSVAGAVGHNVGQLLVAAVILQNFGIASYLPILLVSAVGTGLITGMTVKLALRILKFNH